MIHYFPHTIEECELPLKFTFPFCYTPHPLCVEAAQLVQQQIGEMDLHWQAELEEGKMFGVLLVRVPEGRAGAGRIGFLAAFSGNVCGTNVHPYFVPPVYDLLDPHGFFKPEEARISQINSQIDALTEGEAYQQLLEDKAFMEQHAAQEISAFRSEMKRKKQERDVRREQLVALMADQGPSPELEAQWQELTRESQFLKAELKRKEKSKAAVLAAMDRQIQIYEDRIVQLKEERKERSARLQNAIFEKYILRNARGESKNILQIFQEYSDRTAPAGTGECAAPKLLQYAYLEGLQPLAMAEFWWGKSPVSEIRHHGHFYPSCHSKCEPLLNFMLEGLDVEDNPLKCAVSSPELKVVYEDKWYLAVSKPAGLLSAPGKVVEGEAGLSSEESVWSLLHRQHPEFTGPLVIHRLDMATSGLLLIAKNLDAYVRMQRLFESRQVKKRYIALLEGILERPSCGQICLPIGPDVQDRPRQMVSREYGKEAITDYEILSSGNGRTRIAFWPLTGRTHQLRVHAAHPQGLNTPILGDTLYGGSRQERLYLHAESLSLVHPFTGERLELSDPAQF